MIFRDFNMTDDEVMIIIYEYDNLINKYSRINGRIDEDLKQEITLEIYKTLTKNREDKKFLKKFVRILKSSQDYNN